MPSMLKNALGACALLLTGCGDSTAPDEGALSVETEAGGDAATVSPAPAAPPAIAEDAWYAIIPFEVAPENRARVAELSGATVAPAQAAIGREMLQFFPAGDATSGYLILGRFDSAEDALAHSNPGQDQEFLAAYQAHMGDAGGAATAETMSMMTPGAAMIARRSVTAPPQADGLNPDAAPVYYWSQAIDFTDDRAAQAREVIAEDVVPAGDAAGRDAMLFEMVGDAPFDLLTFFRCPDGDACTPEGVGMFEDVFTRVMGDTEAAASMRAQLDGAIQREAVSVLYRHPAE